jgi:hypothetical protein
LSLSLSSGWRRDVLCSGKGFFMEVIHTVVGWGAGERRRVVMGSPLGPLPTRASRGEEDELDAALSLQI